MLDTGCLLGVSEFRSSIKHLPAAFQPVAKTVEKFRRLLVYRYTDAEAGQGAIDESAFIGINDEIIDILQLPMISPDTQIFSLFDIVRMLREPTEEDD